jgi:hypothetical protein
VNPWIFVFVGAGIVAIALEAWPAAGGLLLALLVIVLLNEARANQQL